MRQLLFASTIILGCADPASPPVGRDATLGDTEALDVTTLTDAGIDGPSDAQRDAVRDVVRDVVREAGADASSADATADDAPIDPGMCGPLTRTCLCECGGAATCQNRCIARNDDCAFCIFDAATRCCPDEWRVLDDCITRSMCMNDPCIADRCGDDQRRFETCFAAAQMGEGACRREMQSCLGSDYPMIRCVVQP